MIDNTEYLNFSENNNILRIYLGANLKKNQNIEAWQKLSDYFNPLTTNVLYHIETSQLTGFYMMENIGL